MEILITLIVANIAMLSGALGYMFGKIVNSRITKDDVRNIVRQLNDPNLHRRIWKERQSGENGTVLPISPAKFEEKIVDEIYKNYDKLSNKR